MASEIVLVRHGATEWSENGRHTSHTDLPLTNQGRAEAEQLCPRVLERHYDLVVTSPLRRARDTAELCGVGDRAEVMDLLHEWDYGEYEGLTTQQIRETVPGWTVWTGACPGGETASEVGERADEVLTRFDAVEGLVAVFSHGHFLRVVIARWLGLAPTDGRLFALATSTLTVLGYERDTRVLTQLNG